MNIPAVSLLLMVIFVAEWSSCATAQGASPGTVRRGATNAPVRSLRHHPTTTAPIPHRKRSSKCLIAGVAHFNNVSLTYTTLREVGLQHNKTFHIQLKIGSEHYQNTASAIKKAEEKAASEAYAQTRYEKPHLKPKSCMIGEKTALSHLHEWSQKNKVSVSCYMKDQQLGPPKVYIMECSANGNVTTQAQGPGKHTAEQEAAEKMLEKLKHVSVGVDLAAKYNTTKYLDMHPVSRLNEIQQKRREIEPAYRLINELRTADAANHEVISFVVQVSAGKYVGIGVGENIKAARREAARNILKLMEFS